MQTTAIIEKRIVKGCFTMQDFKFCIAKHLLLLYNFVIDKISGCEIMNVKPIKNYIFDFGNVIAEFDPIKLTMPYVEDKSLCKAVSEVVFDRLYWNKLDSGDITDDEVREGIRSRLKGSLADMGCRAYDNWVNTMIPVPGMHRLIKDIHNSGGKLYLISNISTGFAQSYDKVPWIKEVLDRFDGIVLSALVGLTKPNGDIFEYLLDKYELKPDECIFVDDNTGNIDGAEGVGIKGYLFDGDSRKLRECLGFDERN